MDNVGNRQTLDAEMQRTASCSCGKLTAQARGEPVRISVCHCLACQKRTGSVFGAQARFPEDAVTVSGPSKEYALATGMPFTLKRPSPTGPCAAPPPRVAVYEGRRHPWVALPPGIERLD